MRDTSTAAMTREPSSERASERGAGQENDLDRGFGETGFGSVGLLCHAPSRRARRMRGARLLPRSPSAAPARAARRAAFAQKSASSPRTPPLRACALSARTHACITIRWVQQGWRVSAYARSCERRAASASFVSRARSARIDALLHSRALCTYPSAAERAAPRAHAPQLRASRQACVASMRLKRRSPQVARHAHRAAACCRAAARCSCTRTNAWWRAVRASQTKV
jgi:hypothetical protein